MAEREKCSAHRTGQQECHNGFPQNAACVGIDTGTLGPWCMNERLCAITFANTGGVPRVIAQALGKVPHD